MDGGGSECSDDEVNRTQHETVTAKTDEANTTQNEEVTEKIDEENTTQDESTATAQTYKENNTQHEEVTGITDDANFSGDEKEAEFRNQTSYNTDNGIPMADLKVKEKKHLRSHKTDGECCKWSDWSADNVDGVLKLETGVVKNSKDQTETSNIGNADRHEIETSNEDKVNKPRYYETVPGTIVLRNHSRFFTEVGKRSNKYFTAICDRCNYHLTSPEKVKIGMSARSNFSWLCFVSSIKNYFRLLICRCFR